LNRSTPEFVTQSAALAFTAAVFIALHVRGQTPVPVQHPHETGVRISLLDEAPIPPPPHPEPPRSQPHAVRTARREAAPLIAAVPIDDARQDSDLPIELPAESPPPKASVSHADIEADYAAALRRNVDERTAVPTTSEYRLLKPSGAAMVCFTLDRSGSPSEVTVKRPSGSKILDTQAARIVASGRYPPFPEAAFPGELRHVFIVTIEFRS
jgi:TonB family protein